MKRKVLTLLVCILIFLPPAVFAQDYCNGNFDCDEDVDGTDAAVFKGDFGRSPFKNPCPGCPPRAPVPKTGQTTSWATGDDGALEKGVEWPATRFRDDLNGTVADNLTGLKWLKNANCFGYRNWWEALSDCNGLANGQCGLTDGSSPGDWRLPNLFELESLRDLQYWEPALSNSAGTGQWTHGDPFINLVTVGHYWSSNTFASSDVDAWYVSWSNGYASGSMKSFTRHVWCVRGGQ
jgi:hypothetical protein